jgi:hypothetical protein
MILHFLKHLFDVGNANRLLPRSLIFPELVHLSTGDLITLERASYQKCCHSSHQVYQSFSTFAAKLGYRPIL